MYIKPQNTIKTFLKTQWASCHCPSGRKVAFLVQSSLFSVLTNLCVLASQKIVPALHCLTLSFFIADNASLLYHQNNRNIFKHGRKYCQLGFLYICITFQDPQPKTTIELKERSFSGVLYNIRKIKKTKILQVFLKLKKCWYNLRMMWCYRLN